MQEIDQPQGAQELVSIDEIDWQIIDALRTNPRASWTLIGQVLQIDPVTATRRWARLHHDGLAWVTAYPGPRIGVGIAAAMIEVDCTPGTTAQVATTLAENPYVFNLKQTAGGRDLMILAVVPGYDGLTRYLAEGLDSIPGVRNTRTSIITGMFAEGSSWRNGALTQQQEQQLAVRVKTVTDKPVGRVDARILSALAVDGRMSINDLAISAETSSTTVRRRLPDLLTNRKVFLRTDIARTLSETPTAATFFVEVSAAALHDAGARIAELPGVRACVTVAGPSNLIIDVWLRHASDIRDFEILLDSQNLPLTVRDRSIVLRITKHASRLLDSTGRATRVVPYDYQTLLTDTTRATSPRSTPGTIRPSAADIDA